MTDAAAAGMLAESALIAHGRGEAFDYLLGEKTCDAAEKAIRETSARMKAAERCVISVNGNAVALAGMQLIVCAAVLNCPVEVNIYYRTPARMEALLSALEVQQKQAVQLYPEIAERISTVPILGANPDGRIPNLEGPRANCHSNGILSADVILVPLEDGDRCEALVAMGKFVIVVDLNPLSRSAKMGSLTIVDELTRFADNLFTAIGENHPLQDLNNDELLSDAHLHIVENATKE